MQATACLQIGPTDEPVMEGKDRHLFAYLEKLLITASALS